ncbi:MAG: hypothetical protein LBK42_06040 [Propionibacteriaceae bacterium]|nr:hypothetical protein [Propionibacteriaceae bacterium]
MVGEVFGRDEASRADAEPSSAAGGVEKKGAAVVGLADWVGRAPQTEGLVDADDVAGLGFAWLSVARLGAAGPGVAGLGVARLGVVGLGLARLGVAGLGLA